MLLFIFESISTSEIILIGAVALVVFGPRKLPQMARTVAKMMAEFKNATNEFKTTWEKEVSSLEIENEPQTKTIHRLETASRANNFAVDTQTVIEPENQYPKPSIKEMDSEEISKNFQNTKVFSNDSDTAKSNGTGSKRDWL